MRLAWVTDLHLNDQPKSLKENWVNYLLRLKPDHLLITGDISEGEQLIPDLTYVTEALPFPVHFVLGNHDFYGCKIEKRRSELSHFSYLTTSNPIPLTETVSLIGYDGWADATVGDFIHSSIKLRDYKEILDLQDREPENLKEKLHELGKASALALQSKLQTAFKQANTLLIALHPPPFKEACLYGEDIADDHWAPHFVAGLVGEMLLSEMKRRPDKVAYVFAGHTHNRASCLPLPNLKVFTGQGVTENHLIEKLLVV